MRDTRKPSSVDEVNHLMLNNSLPFLFQRSYFAVTFAASNLGYAVSLAPDAKKATRAAEAILEVLNREPQLLPDVGDFPDSQISGEVVFNNLHFRYPTRKKVPVLKVSIIIINCLTQPSRVLQEQLSVDMMVDEHSLEMLVCSSDLLLWMKSQTSR